MRQYNPIYPSIRKIQSPDTIKVNWVLLNKSPTQNKIIKGEEFVIQATVMPNNALNKRLSWAYSPMDGSLRISSTDRNHQRVTIIADHVGIYYITCTTTDGSNIQNTIQLMVSNLEGEDFKPITSFSWTVEQQSEDIEFSSNSFNTVESDNPITMTFLCNPSDATWKTYNYDFYFTGEDNINNFGYSSQEGNYEGTLPEDFSIDDSNPEQIKIIMPGNLIGAVKITLSALDGSDVTKIFTGTIKEAYIAIQDVTLEVVDNITECDIGDTITCIITVIPANATEFINGELKIQYTASIDTSRELKYEQSTGTWTYKFSPQESGNLIITWTVTSEGVSGFSKQLQTHTIKVGKVITPMTDSELSAHLSERRFENLLDSSHFESIEEITQFVREKDFHDIYIGDYIPVSLPWCYWDSYNRSMTTKNLSVQTNLRVVDINYLLNKNVGITTNHLVLWPDTIIGIGPMSDTQNIQGEIVQMGSYYQRGRGYYNNYMVNTVLPYIRNKLTTALGGNYLLTYTDSVPVYYSNSYWGGTLNQVSYQSVANTSLRLPNSVVYGYSTGTDKNSIWNTFFRLFETNSEYTLKESPSGATVSTQGAITTDINAEESSLQADALSWRIRNGGGSHYTMGYEEGDNPICPIIIFG